MPAKKKLSEIRKEPGKSNAYKYSSKETFAGPDNTYPLTKNGKPSLKRSNSAKKLAHNSPQSGKIKAAADRMIAKITGKRSKAK